MILHFQLRFPLSLLILLLSIFLRRSESSCRNDCDLALGSYYVTTEASNLTYVSHFFNQRPAEVLPYNNLTNQDSIITGTRLNIGFPCDCISGDFFGRNFSYTARSGDTYYIIATSYYANLTTADWLAATNSIPADGIQIGDLINVVINCSCGDPGVSREYGLFETYPLRPGETLDSVAAEFNLSSQKSLIQQYNPGKNFNAGTGIVFVPTRGLTGGAIAGICVGVIVVLLIVVIFLYFGLCGKKKGKKTLLPSVSDDSTPMRRAASDKNTALASLEGTIATATSLSVEKSVEFSLEELAKATNDFSMANKIGQGGFGSVYYAELRGERFGKDEATIVNVKNYQKAAIKKMDMEASREFLAELKVLTHVHHLNLVSFYSKFPLCESFSNFQSTATSMYKLFQKSHNGKKLKLITNKRKKSTRGTFFFPSCIDSKEYNI
ncbi:hypothetical protein M5K25_023835 [Dendrobium thyrsiflorum]|uniref:Uncharacterized protein n=1 Tax=Dendrobium thyrsiflorum TaxID=117978 RepID=A0ABD0U0G9_DENTH